MNSTVDVPVGITNNTVDSGTINSSKLELEAVAPHLRKTPFKSAVTMMILAPEVMETLVEALIVASYVIARVGAFGFVK